MSIRPSLLGVLVSLGSLAALAVPASALVACNKQGVCWHTNAGYRDFHPEWGVTLHDDAWHWRGAQYRWREHDGRGYWRGGVWIAF